MIDGRLFERLAQHETPVEVPAELADALYERLQADRRARAAWSRSALLLVAALLMTLAAASAIAIGSGVLRVDDDDPLEMPLGGALDCSPAEPTMADDALLVADVYVAGAPERDQHLALFEDGRLVTGQANERLTDGADLTARRLSPRGIGLVLDAVEASNLVVPGCHIDLWAETPLRGLSTRSDGVAEGVTHWGRYLGLTRTMSSTEAAAATALVEKLETLESWLPQDAWIDASSRPYLPERWVVSIVRLPPDLAYTELEDPASNAAGAPPAAEVVLPDGGSLLAFGTEFREPDIERVDPDGTKQTQEGPLLRCAIVTGIEALALADALDATEAPIANSAWWLSDDPDLLGVRAFAVGPQTGGCARFLASEIPPPTAIAPPTPEANPADLETCADVLSESEANDILPRADEFPVRLHVDTLDRHTVTYANCGYWNDQGGDSLILYVRPGTVSTADTAHLATLWVGLDAPQAAVAGATVRENGCRAAGSAYCTPAFAVHVANRFLVIPDPPQDTVLEQVIAAVAERLGEER